MTTLAPTGDPSLWALVNDSGSGGVFGIHDGSSSSYIFKVYSDGRVEVFGRLYRDATDPPTFWNKSLTGNGTILAIAGGQKALYFDVVTDGVQIRSSAELEVAGDPVQVRLSSSGAITSFVDAAGTTVADSLGGAKFRFPNYLTGTAALDGSPGGIDSADVALGSIAAGRNARGRIDIHADRGVNTERAGVIVLEDQDGVSWYLWVDSNGDLRIYNGDPGTDDTLGTAV